MRWRTLTLGAAGVALILSANLMMGRLAAAWVYCVYSAHDAFSNEMARGEGGRAKGRSDGVSVHSRVRYAPFAVATG